MQNSTPIFNDIIKKRNMICVKMYGGLGNQLFQYAFGRGISEKTGHSLELDVNSGFENDFFKRTFQLNNFDIKADIVDTELLKKNLFLRKNLFGKLYRRSAITAPHIFKRYFKEQNWFEYYPEVFRKKSNVYFDGYWQNINYFKNIKSQLETEITYKKEFELDLIQKTEILNSESVAVHIRYPHAYSNGNLYKKAEDIFCITPIDYYIQAIQLMENKISQPSFFVFSDNLQWARKSLCDLNQNIHYVENSKNDLQDFELMKNCTHFIMSNSTFSWWAAFLGQTEKSIVITPKKWFHNFELKIGSFFLDNWILL